MTDTQFTQWMQDPRRKPLVMGVLNVTPDSFSDGGKFFDPAAAVEHARKLCEDGADVLDIGGESTRPGAQRVDSSEQIRRIIPVIRQVAETMNVLLSVDTTRAAVAEAALDAGAHLINDISAGRDDPEMFPLVARRGVPIVLMHMLGEPATMQSNPSYTDVIAEVAEFLVDRVSRAVEAGIERSRILIDPGIGFGKTIEHNLALLHNLSRLADLGFPMVVGVSRKRFIGRLTGEENPQSRLMGTAAAVAWAAANRTAIHRVHDVKDMRQVIQVITALQQGVPPVS